MKKFILAAIVLLSAVSMSAQQQRRQFSPEEQATRQATQIKETCNTNDDQYKALYTLFLDQANKMKAQRDSLRAAGNNGGGRPNFNREEWQKHQEETNAKIKEILTPEQYTAYEESLKKMRERRGMGGGNRGPRNQQQ